VCGPAPLLGCRPIRVRVESIYIVSHLLSIDHPLHYSTWYQRIRFRVSPPTSHTSRQLLPPRGPAAAPGRLILPSRGRPHPSSQPLAAEPPLSQPTAPRASPRRSWRPSSVAPAARLQHRRGPARRHGEHAFAGHQRREQAGAGRRRCPYPRRLP
jgi:hypothetical protein